MAIVDIDFFKAVNDTHGHPAGDQVLRELAARLEASVRATDMAARLGGEEFILVMTETDLNTAQVVTARICRDIEVSPFAGSMIQNGLSITASIGVAVTDNREETVEELIKRSDDALYEAKRGGRNQVVTAAAVA